MSGNQGEELEKARRNLLSAMRANLIFPHREKLFDELMEKARFVPITRNLPVGKTGLAIILQDAAKAELIIGERDFHLHHLRVEPHLRSGLEIGSRLLAGVERLALSQGKDYLTLEAWPLRYGEPHPYQFYLKNGYVLAPNENPAKVDVKVAAGERVEMVKYLTHGGKRAFKSNLKAANKNQRGVRVVIEG
ncbi:hypothetical protein HY095_05200 [Candidatus Micrarchaeota archaeon]|nr:hypothetical protein [Candidatus Micrarchaeota archaeon]